MRGRRIRLISADKLKQDVLDWKNCYNGFSDTYDKAMIIDEIDAQPTVDAEPIVRCKDCKRRLKDGRCGDLTPLWGAFEDDFYCAMGERKDER